MAMGRAFASLSGDASSAFSNPAATAFIDRGNFTAFHTSLFLGTNYDCLALSQPVGLLGVFTLSAGRLGTNDFTGRDEFNRPDKIISASETQLGLSYGRTIGWGFASGLTFKGVGQKIGDNAGYGFGLDAGIQLAPKAIPGVILGIGINNLIQPRIKLLEGEDKYQTDTRAGLAYTRKFTRNFAATGIFEIQKISGRETMNHPGFEAAFWDSYFLRFGYDHNRPTFGGGIIYSFIKLDYAYENIEDLGGSHRISLGFSFGKSARKAQEESIARAVETERLGWENSLDQQKALDFTFNITRADSLRAAGQSQDALFYYQRALSLDETSERARAMSDTVIGLIIADAALNASDQKREELSSKRIESALGHFKAGRYNEAIAQYELALEIDPGNKTVSELLTNARATRSKEIESIRRTARAYSSAKNFASAIADWNRLLALEPGDVEASRNIEQLKSQIKADALTAQAVTAINEARYTDAVGLLEQARSLRPGDKTLETLLADARNKSAPQTTLSDIKANPDHWATYLKGLEGYQADDFVSALKSWESLKSFYPNNPDLDKNISQARQRLSTEGGKP